MIKVLIGLKIKREMLEKQNESNVLTYLLMCEDWGNNEMQGYLYNDFIDIFVDYTLISI